MPFDVIKHNDSFQHFVNKAGFLVYLARPNPARGRGPLGLEWKGRFYEVL
jgi:hypothetical protein